MRRRFINKKFALSWVFSLLMVVLYTARADNGHPQYSLQLTGGKDNPWAIPQPDPAPENYPQYNQYQNQQYQSETENRQNQGRSSNNRIYQGNRFVTDEFLKSLNRQQSQFQVMPDYRRYPQYVPQQPAPGQQKPISPGPGALGYPSYGTGYVEPLVDTLSDVPVVTPWTPWDIGVSDW